MITSQISIEFKLKKEQHSKQNETKKHKNIATDCPWLKPMKLAITNLVLGAVLCDMAKGQRDYTYKSTPARVVSITEPQTSLIVNYCKVTGVQIFGYCRKLTNICSSPVTSIGELALGRCSGARGINQDCRMEINCTGQKVSL